MPKVYIIILNYKKWMDARECLETLFRSGYGNFTAIIIDNDSQNDSLQQLMHWAENHTDLPDLITPFPKKNIERPIACTYLASGGLGNKIKPGELPQLVFIQNEKNTGFAAGINIMLQHLLQEDAYVWLLNPDMTVEESTLAQLLRFADSKPRRSIIGSVIKYYDKPAEVHFYAGGKINFNSATVEMITNKNKIAQLDYISGGSLFTHAGNFIELGLLPQDYFLYWEETDLCYHAKKLGYKLLLCEAAVCYDKVSTSIGKNFLSDYYYTRNGLLFLSKYKKEKVPAAVFFILFRLLKRILSGQFGRAKGMYKGMRSFLNMNKHAHK